uniref:Uncharacterized protein n=1 Tax=Mandrillus leucophaeus TaxID=9568 RepID=A0A2K5ZIS5_MANLE
EDNPKVTYIILVHLLLSHGHTYLQGKLATLVISTIAMCPAKFRGVILLVISLLSDLGSHLNVFMFPQCPGVSLFGDMDEARMGPAVSTLGCPIGLELCSLENHSLLKTAPTYTTSAHICSGPCTGGQFSTQGMSPVQGRVVCLPLDGEEFG